MNNYFLDITAKSREGLSAIYGQLHLTIKDNDGNIAVGFPQYHYNEAKRHGDVGLTLRVFANTSEQLSRLQLEERANALQIPITLHPIRPIPNKVLGHAVIGRARRKSQSHVRRDARRAVAKGRFTDIDEAMTLLNKQDMYNPLPALFLSSRSTGKEFPVHISITPAPAPVQGSFSSYGLSQGGATIPIF